jgi:uncharacterized protein YjdB
MKRQITALLIFATTLCVLIGSCSNKIPEVVSVSGVKLDKSSMGLAVGESRKLTATVEPKNATDKGVSWESDNDPVATVDQDGNVTGISSGKGGAKITVTTDDGGYKATCDVGVVEIPVEKVTLDHDKIELEVDNPYQFSWTIVPDGASIKEVKFSSSDENVVRCAIEPLGLIYPLKAGNATITVTTVGTDKDDKQCKAECEVTVK